MLFQLHFYTLYFFVPCQAPRLDGSTLSPKLKCIHVADCIAHSMLYYEGISSPVVAYTAMISVSHFTGLSPYQDDRCY